MDRRFDLRWRVSFDDALMAHAMSHHGLALRPVDARFVNMGMGETSTSGMATV